MRSAKQIQGSIDELRDEISAIVAVSKQEDRDLNQEETVRVNEVSEVLIPELKAKLSTAEAIERELLANRSGKINAALKKNEHDNGGRIDADEESSEDRLASIKVPARAKAHGKLTAFQGENAEREAFVAGNVILAGIYGNQRASEWCNSHGLNVRATMSTGTNSTGGFLVPEEMSNALIRLREERGVFPQYANRVPMGSDIISVPRLLADCTAYWVGEGLEITASDATLGQARLMAIKLGALTKISSELDQDSVVMIGDMVTTSMAYAMADKIDEAAFNGDGTSTYGGVLGLKNALSSSAVIDAATGNDAPNNLDLVDFESVVGAYPQYPGAAPRWFMHSAVYYAAANRLMNAAGGNTNMTLANGLSSPMFLGYPVQFTQVMHSTTSTSASTIVAYFGDLRLGASYGTRRSARTEVSTERYFELDLIGIKSTERVAINIHEIGADIRTRPILALKTAS